MKKYPDSLLTVTRHTIILRIMDTQHGCLINRRQNMIDKIFITGIHLIVVAIFTFPVWAQILIK